jgi:predicted GIY-YIG superfamily endonuclease
MTAAVYRHYDAAGCLLYVGMSADPMSRSKAHRSASGWFTEVRRIEIDWFESKSAAIAAEREMTARLQPLHLPSSPNRKRTGDAPQTALARYIASQPKRPMVSWAFRFGVSRPMVYDLMNGNRYPSPAVAQRIAEQTGGAVPVTSWPNMAAVVSAASQGAAA